MIRRLMASTAVLALITAGTFGIAQAQTEPAEQPAAAQQDATSTDQGAAPAGDAAATSEQPPPEDQSAASEQPADATATAAAESDATLTPERPTIATAFIGQSVFSSEDPDSDNIGDVKDLIISDDGMITHAVVGVGGFLGIGEKEVAVPFDELQVVEDEDGDIRLIYAATREQLETAEPFDRATYDPEERAAEAQQAAADADAGADTVTPAPSTDTAATPAEQEAPAEESAEATTEPAAGTEQQTTAEATTEPAAGTEQQTTAEATTEPAAGTDQQQTTAEATTEPAAGTDQQQTTAEATTEPAAGTDQQQTAQLETEAAAGADQQQMAQTEAGAAFDAESGFVSFSADQVRASTLMGQEIYGPDDESIGEVSDLVLQEDGETRAALIDVGGFLGVGEKEVAIPFEQIEVQPGQNGEEPRLKVAMSREELEQLPAWEDPAETAEADQTGTAGTDQQQTDTAATTEQPQGQDAQTAETEAAQAEQPMPAGELAAVGSQDLSAENLIGTAIYSPEDKAVGEVGDVIFDQGGSIQAVIVDVGGFLGVGEKPVAIQFDALNVQKDTNGDLRLMVNATQEQLENAPAYEVGEQPAQ